MKGLMIQQVRIQMSRIDNKLPPSAMMDTYGRKMVLVQRYY